MILIQPNRKFLLFCFFIVIIPVRSFAQEREILLIANFDNWVSIAFDLNNIAVGYGDNRWTINKSYSGAGGHPNTPAQDITYSGGKIGGEGNYLHINDLPSSSLNASFNPNNNSERWAVMQWGICTHGFDKIEVNFWFVADGSNNAYGEVYYSIDSGATWVLTTNTEGFAKYKGYDKWKEITIQEPAFINHVDLRIGYKWTNIGASSTDELPFSVDDIMILGYTSPTPSIVLTVDSISADTLCQEEEGGFKVYFSTSDSICPYELLVLELSDSNGSFTDAKILTSYGNPTANAFFSPSPINPGTKWITPPMGPIHSDVPKGSCYKIRIRMLSPPYAISNPYSGCVNIIDCTDSIETLQPAVLNDTSMLSNHICIYSVIDVPFYSYGGYNPGNKYVLELSDSSGGFSNSIVISDSVSSTTTFNPIIYPAPNSPGMIKGKIPYMPTGCNYYVRVVATDPNVPDSNIVSYGPF